MSVNGNEAAVRPGPPVLTLSNVSVGVGHGPDGSVVLGVQAQNGAFEIQVPLPAEVARHLAGELAGGVVLP